MKAEEEGTSEARDENRDSVRRKRYDDDVLSLRSATVMYCTLYDEDDICLRVDAVILMMRLPLITRWTGEALQGQAEIKRDECNFLCVVYVLPCSIL